MSSQDESPDAGKRRRRRSLRVPADEVPRPTQHAAGDGRVPFEVGWEADESGTTVEDDARYESAVEPGGLGPIDEMLLGAPDESGASSGRVAEDDDDGPETFIEAVSPETLRSAPSSVEIELGSDENGMDDDGAARRRPTSSDPGIGVVVQRVVAVASSITNPPPPDDEEEMLADSPPDDVAVDLDELSESDSGDGPAYGDEPASYEEEPELREGWSDERRALEEPRGRAPNFAAQPDPSTELPEGLSWEEEAYPAMSPPPPPGGVTVKPQTPPRRADGAESRATEGRAPSPTATAGASLGKRRKPHRRWWEGLFNDDYLRTVPIPHPKTVLAHCDFIEARLGLAKGSTILDVGCGLGLVAVELTRRGYLVVGLDLSLPMLSRAADEAREHGFKINFLHADMREMNFDGAFDAVLCWGTTFGYFDDDANKRVVERLYRALKPRGLLLLDVVNRDYVIQGQPNLVWFEGDGCVVMEETQMNYITSRLEVKRNVILDDGRQRDTQYSLRLYALHELGQVLHAQGFRVVEVTGREAHPGVFFGADSPKLIIVAERRPPGPPQPPGRSPSGEHGSGSEPPSQERAIAESGDAEELLSLEDIDEQEGR